MMTMSSEEMIKLARRAVASPHWRWMPGMLEVGGVRAIGEQYLGEVWVEQCGGGYAPIAGWLPDLTDPATLGCLLALAREALGFGVWLEPVAVQGQPIRWCVYGIGVLWDSGTHDTEAAALVAALEAAPTPEER